MLKKNLRPLQYMVLNYYAHLLHLQTHAPIQNSTVAADSMLQASTDLLVIYSSFYYSYVLIPEFPPS